MVDVSIKSLISMAQDYVENRGVDKDKSGSINSDRELNLLLAGTGASSIEDLTSANVHKKIIERDTEKVFTSFMATNNHEQAKMNIELLKGSIHTISNTYDNLLEGFERVDHLMRSSAKRLDEFEQIFNEGNFGQEAVNDVIDRLKEFDKLTREILHRLKEINEGYKNTTGQDFPPIEEKEMFLYNSTKILNEQIDKLKNGSVPIEKIKDEIQKGFKQVIESVEDTKQLKEQYENQRKNDIYFCNELLEWQMKFTEDDSNKADNQAMSRELLGALVDKTSPMTRNFVIEQAERVYNPKNDPTTTGISQNNSASNIKRSSYKTPTEIYTLKGNNVIVSDYSGKVLRNEKLDPVIHKRFYE